LKEAKECADQHEAVRENALKAAKETEVTE
jgi:hypothetical protein